MVSWVLDFDYPFCSWWNRWIFLLNPNCSWLNAICSWLNPNCSWLKPNCSWLNPNCSWLNLPLFSPPWFDGFPLKLPGDRGKAGCTPLVYVMDTPFKNWWWLGVPPNFRNPPYMHYAYIYINSNIWVCIHCYYIYIYMYIHIRTVFSCTCCNT